MDVGRSTKQDSFSQVEEIVAQLAEMAKDFSGAGEFFDVFDTDSSSFVTNSEFHKAIREVWGDHFVSQSELDAAFDLLDSHFDPNGDGRIDLDEFKEALVSKLGTVSRQSENLAIEGSPFVVGDRIEAKCNNWIKFFPGQIEKQNGDFTYFVQFDDGERRDVKESEMRKLDGPSDGLDTEAAAVALQASMRRRKAKKHVEVKRKEAHATRKIQAVTRGRRDRKRVRKLREQ